MSTDWYAQVKPRKRVTLEDVMMRATLYLTDCAEITERVDPGGDEHVVVRVRGSVSDPWHKVVDPQPSRWFELRLVTLSRGGRALRVTTRMMDPFTRDVAEAFARRCAAEWGTSLIDVDLA